MKRLIESALDWDEAWLLCPISALMTMLVAQHAPDGSALMQRAKAGFAGFTVFGMAIAIQEMNCDD